MARRQYATGILTLCMVNLLIQHASTHVPSPNDFQWRVKHEDILCMIMGFNATIEFDEPTLPQPIYIPTSADASPSMCGDDFSIFMLQFDVDVDVEIEIAFMFNKTDTEWMMTMLEVELYNDTSFEVLSLSKSAILQEEFTVALGYYLECESKLRIDSTPVTFDFIEVMQPFAVDDEGIEYICLADRPSSTPRLGLIVICVIAAMLLAVGSCYVYNRMINRRSIRYRRSLHYVN
ncbi:uncharacterized protein [Diadema setosum]|uniref:uncharacterized protein n=1 Tax=Diadema setosum TaxID=31175 RepID=UPI003B3BDC47